MTVQVKHRKQNAARGASRAAQNRKVRQDALRQELANRNYVSQLQKIADRLDPDARDAYQREDVPMVKERVGILFRMLDKTLPNLKPVELPVTFPVKQSLADQAASILRAVATGKITPGDATALMNALAAQAKITEVDDLEKRITKLERAHGN